MDYTLTATVAAVVGVFLPTLIQLIVKKYKDARIKYLWALGISVAIGLIDVFAAGKFSLNEFAVTFGLVFGASQTVYALYWKPFLFDKPKKKK